MGDRMADRIEKRATERRNYPVPIEISYVREGKRVHAQSLNHCQDGMCFESTSAFHPGVTLNVRVNEFHPHGPCVGRCEGLRHNTLAEVKWCREFSDAQVTLYRVGVQFLAPIY